MNEDFCDFLTSLVECGVRFLVVGAHALAIHGIPRATGDLDIWIDRSAGNVERVWRALITFGAPVDSLSVDRSDLEQPDIVVQIGMPPRRIDVLTSITGVEFPAGWEDRVMHTVESVDVPFIGRHTLIKNKRATGRLRDLADLEALGEETEQQTDT